MANAEQLEFGWRFGDSLTPDSFKIVLEERVYRVDFIELDGHGYTIPAFKRKGIIPLFTILIKDNDTELEQQKTLVHEALHIHRGIDLFGKIHNMFNTRNPVEDLKQREEEEQIEDEAGRFIQAHPQVVRNAMLMYKTTK